MCDLNGLDTMLLSHIREARSWFVLPRSDGWTRSASGARYVATAGGFVTPEDGSGKLVTDMSVIAVGRDEKRRSKALVRQAERLSRVLYSLLSVDWWGAFKDSEFTLAMESCQLSDVRVRFNHRTQEFVGPQQNFFTFRRNSRYRARIITDERASQFFRAANPGSDGGLDGRSDVAGHRGAGGGQVVC